MRAKTEDVFASAQESDRKRAGVLFIHLSSPNLADWIWELSVHIQQTGGKIAMKIEQGAGEAIGKVLNEESHALVKYGDDYVHLSRVNNI